MVKLKLVRELRENKVDEAAMIEMNIFLSLPLEFMLIKKNILTKKPPSHNREQINLEAIKYDLRLEKYFAKLPKIKKNN